MEGMEEQDEVAWLKSHLGEAGQVGNATSVVLIPSHEDIAFVAPVFSPAVFNYPVLFFPSGSHIPLPRPRG